MTATHDRAGWLRRDAEHVSGSLPPLLIEAERLAANLLHGVHGRRHAGIGETFWQYRAAQPGDPASLIDWRRSARSDRLYVRELEWEAAEAGLIWCDTAQSMDFRSAGAERTKGERARLIAMALSVLLVRGGERVGLLGTEAERPTTGEGQLQRIAAMLSTEAGKRPDFGAPPLAALPRASKAIFLSDFMGPRGDIFPALEHAAGHGIRGAYVQILDPAEEVFPFGGRTLFASMAGQTKFETDQARSLREAYLGRLAERRDDLALVARRAGWELILHRTDESPRGPLLRLHAILSEGGR